MVQYFLAELHNMAESEMLDMLEPGVIDQIKAAGDDHPVIKVFSIAHEGVSTPSMVTPQGKVSITMQYLRDAVKLVAQKVKAGVAVFNRHGKTNAHAGRMPIGRVVGKALKEIDGILHALTAIHIFPKHREDSLDVASFEAEAKFGTDENNKAKLWDMNDITGIALGSKEQETPAFPGATLHGAFQCFAEQSTITPKGEGKTMITVQDVQGAIAQGVFSVDQILGTNDLLGHPKVKEAIEAAKHNQKEQYETMRRLSEAANTRVDDMAKQLAERDEKITEINASALRQKSGGIFEKIAANRKLNEKQKGFCEFRMKEFTCDAIDDANLEKAVNDYTDTMLQEHEDSAKFYDAKQDSGDEAGAPPGSGSQDGAGDLTDPKNNPFIPQ